MGSVQARKNHERYSHPHEALAAGLISALPKEVAECKTTFNHTRLFPGRSQTSQVCRSHVGSSVANSTCPRNGTMAVPARRQGNGVLRSQLKETNERLDALEQRVDKVEYTVELQEAYRHLRVEHSVRIAGIWSRFESGEIPASEIKARVVQALHEELDGIARAEWTEEAVQAKAMLLSQGKRGIGNAESRRSCLQGLRFDGILHWVQKDRSGAICLILSRGEPARLVFDRVRSEWSMFYVLSRMVDAPNGIQLYPDKGPKVRAARAKGKGKQKGQKGKKGRGKGKGRGAGKGKGAADSDAAMDP